ncbi:hypothetical protein TNCT_121441 [Trichonephila clavata]|uniref:Uncharacterized protein n=1 Tax=Trichonephila clavata TaxID=2740835 RepID=A0A8X6KJE1_TRICU|nr:hypothetical protein TNCT_121441 [Trichonephila clavata]
MYRRTQNSGKITVAFFPNFQRGEFCSEFDDKLITVLMNADGFAPLRASFSNPLVLHLSVGKGSEKEKGKLSIWNFVMFVRNGNK